jgi:hypothetical protein
MYVGMSTRRNKIDDQDNDATLSRNVIGFPSIADHSVAKCMLLLASELTRGFLQACLRAVCSACGFLTPSHVITSHHITFDTFLCA